ncbi:beta-ketoacyl synthase [Bacteroides sp. 519]|uniref:beta-ketoacyl-[acyl-carrier-protein] synthase family protein n=1 Tax=Bacteroides sp. 519 TaxID=2302937 RepID=UPI0013D710AB|nr:beta-ketoacyl synthase N-terminal-like domain-containing protein [Bacteroides sp. 519]NDV58761.1 beta-ACP synthase [Bacteroides sp. 519]
MGNRINVYIKADNIISSLGFTTDENLEAIRNYCSGIKLHAVNDVSDFPIWAALVDSSRLNEQAEQSNLQSYTRAEQLAILSISDVVKQSGIKLNDPACGLIFASTKGNIELLRHNSNYCEADVSLWKMGERIAGYFGSNDYHILSNACISGVSALIVAKRWIESGRYKQVVVTGVDVLSHFITSGFASFKSVSKQICRPYDAERDGLNLGEGCGTILLSANASANDILLTGGAISNDANHLSGPSRTGDGLHLAISQAMNDAGVTADSIGMVNAHGTATVYNDEMEAKAMHLASLHVPVNSLKSYFGHTLGASGVIETIITARGMKEETIFGTYNFNQPGVSVPLQVSSTHTKSVVNACVKTASGFGGCNAAIVLSLTPAKTDFGQKEAIAVQTIASVRIENNILWKNNEILLQSEDNLAGFMRQAYKATGGNNLKFYQLSEFCKMGTVASLYLLKDIAFQPEEMGIVMANANASLCTDAVHQHIIDDKGDLNASPAVFVFTLPNVVTGQMCISNKIKGENTFFINKTCNFEELKAYAALVMNRTNLKYCIIGWCDATEDNYETELILVES